MAAGIDGALAPDAVLVGLPQPGRQQARPVHGDQGRRSRPARRARAGRVTIELTLQNVDPADGAPPVRPGAVPGRGGCRRGSLPGLRRLRAAAGRQFGPHRGRREAGEARHRRAPTDPARSRPRTSRCPGDRHAQWSSAFRSPSGTDRSCSRRPRGFRPSPGRRPNWPGTMTSRGEWYGDHDAILSKLWAATSTVVPVKCLSLSEETATLRGTVPGRAHRK